MKMAVPRVGVGVFVLRSAQHSRFLLGKRKGSHGAGKLENITNGLRGTDLVPTGTYALPGGHLEHGETFEQCAAREVKEETELTVQDLRFLTATNSVFEDSGEHYVTIFMTAIAAEGDVVKNMEPDKCEGWLWHTFTEMREMPSTGSKLFLPLHSLMEQRPEVCAQLAENYSSSVYASAPS